MRQLHPDQLLTFSTVIAHASFSLAAEQLGLSQPAVSRQVKELERRLQLRLAERVGRRVHATAAGAELLVHAERVRRSLREEKVAARFTASHPKVPTVAVPALASDVHDLDGLRQIGGLLAGVAQPTAAAD